MKKEPIGIAFIFIFIILNISPIYALFSLPPIPSDYSSFIKEKIDGPWNLRIFSQINSAGIHLSLVSTPSSPDTSFSYAKTEIYYKKTSSASWIKSHPFTGKINETYDLYITSIFYLEPDTSYDLKVILKSTTGAQIREILDNFKTQPDSFSFNPLQTLIVDQTGNGDFTTIQAALNDARTVAGTRIIVKPGLYRESLKITKSGTPRNWIQILGQPGAVLEGHDMALENLGQGQWQQYTNTQAINGGNLWQLSLSSSIYSVWRNENYFYRYVEGSSGRTEWTNFLNDASGQADNCDDIPYSDPSYQWHLEEGYYYDSTAQKLYLRLKAGDTPNAYPWYVAKFNNAIEISNQNWIWIEGLTIKYYGHSKNNFRAISLTNSNFNIIRKNNLTSNANGIRVYWSDTNNNEIADDGGAANRIEHNTITTNIPSNWRYCHVKKGASFIGIDIKGSVANVIRHNTLFSIGENSIQLQPSTAQLPCTDTGGCPKLYYYYGFETDIYGNYIHDNVEGIEPDGPNLNLRIYENYLKRMASYAISLQPGQFGPHWIIRNIYDTTIMPIIEPHEGFLKIRSPKVPKYIYLYHNDHIQNRDKLQSDAAIVNRQQFKNLVIRNNIFTTGKDLAGRFACNEPTETYVKANINYNNYYTANAYFLNVEKKNSGTTTDCSDVRYKTITEACKARVECQGRFGDPGFISSIDFSLKSTSGNINKGVQLNVLPFISDNPDIGALEYGQSLICDKNNICEPAVGETSSCQDCPNICHDSDNDGHTSNTCGGDDCDDTNANKFPGNPEICGNDIDEDCSGSDLICGPPENKYVIDNEDTTGFSKTGTWSVSGNPNPYQLNSIYAKAFGPTATWSFSNIQSGSYDVYAWWTAGSGRVDNAPYKINYNGGSATIRVNQKSNGGQWNRLGTTSFNFGTTGSVVLTAETSLLSTGADAVCLVTPGGICPFDPSALVAPAQEIRRGDTNNDGIINIADPIQILGWLFQGQKKPKACTAGDVNNDGRIDIADPIYILNYLFKGGPAPAEPFGKGKMPVEIIRPCAADA